jgi:hypothetical protein
MPRNRWNPTEKGAWRSVAAVSAANGSASERPPRQPAAPPRPVAPAASRAPSARCSRKMDRQLAQIIVQAFKVSVCHSKSARAQRR